MLRNKSFPALLCSKSQESCAVDNGSYCAYNTGVIGNATIWRIISKFDSILVFKSFSWNLAIRHITRTWIAIYWNIVTVLKSNDVPFQKMYFPQTPKHISIHRIKNCWQWFDDNLLLMVTADAAQALTTHTSFLHSVHRKTSHRQWLI